jgi:hypothetical protein
MWRKPCLIEKSIFSKPLGDLNQRWLQRSIETTVCARFAQYFRQKSAAPQHPANKVFELSSKSSCKRLIR